MKSVRQIRERKVEICTNANILVDEVGFHLKALFLTQTSSRLRLVSKV
ncbi:hypothetical protein OH492_22335 [Vibrio chagasii]|nr:hypothetical protein [Vibrio chagasii]